MKHLRIVFVLLMMIATLVESADLNTKVYREVSWDDLMPEGWVPPPPEPIHDFFSSDQSSDEQTQEDDFNPVPISIPDSAKAPAPIVQSLDKQKLRIPGYLIPIKFSEETVSEFLLVPYIGACVHVPPPPENQIIYVTLRSPLVSPEFWEPVWVSGEMNTKISLTEYATAGYQMLDAITEPYEF